MSDAPEVRYASSGEVEIAYQVLGNGPVDVVWVAGSVTHLGVLWEHPGYRHFCEQLASFSRLILFDKRGMGLSERTRAGTLEQRMDDVRAVMDAAGSERAALVGVSEGGPMSMLFAATYPERTEALLLIGAEVKEEQTDDWPWGEGTREEFDEWTRELPERWGRALVADRFFPDDPDPETTTRWFGRLQTSSMTPRDAIAFLSMAMDIDVRDVVPSVRVPTLIVHRLDDPICHVENARFLAANIPNARYVELPGSLHIPWAGSGGGEILEEIREFLTGVRESPQPDRVLATVLFTDIVGSTERATQLGDRRWRHITQPCGSSSSASAAVSSTPPATGSSRASTAPRERSAAPGPRSTPSAGSDSSSVPACTRASARSSGTSWPASPFTSARAWRVRRGREKCWSRARCATLSRALASSSRIAARPR